MQKKRWIFYNNEIKSTNSCTDCDYIMNGNFCRKLWRCVNKRLIDKDCPLIEAETKEEAFQKIREVFDADKKSDGN